MKKWENTHVKIKRRRHWDDVIWCKFYMGGNDEYKLVAMNEYFGERGWELVSVDRGIAYLKRPIEESK